MQLGAGSTQTLSKRTLSVKTSSTLRFLAGLADKAASLGARRTNAPDPRPDDEAGRTSAPANAEKTTSRQSRTVATFDGIVRDHAFPSGLGPHDRAGETASCPA
jgi:hypothetical protein